MEQGQNSTTRTQVRILRLWGGVTVVWGWQPGEAWRKRRPGQCVADTSIPTRSASFMLKSSLGKLGGKEIAVRTWLTVRALFSC